MLLLAARMSHQEAIVELFRSVKCIVWVTSTNRASRLPPGFPDLLVSHPKLGAPLAWESKRPKEPVTDAQLQFEVDWLYGGGLYGRGGYQNAYRFLQEWGLIAK